MAYAAQTDIVARYGANILSTIADPDGTGTVQVPLIAQALGDASEVIDSHLQERYLLPLATVPSLLVVLTVDIAVYRLAVLPTDEMRHRYDDAMKMLKSIATGVLQLGLAPPPPTEGQAAVLVSPARLFGRNQERNW